MQNRPALKMNDWHWEGPGGAKIATVFRYRNHAKQLTTAYSLLRHFEASALTALLRSRQNKGAFNSSLTCAVIFA